MNGKWELAKVIVNRQLYIKVYSTNRVMLDKLSDIVYDSVSLIGDKKIQVKKVINIGDFSYLITPSKEISEWDAHTILWTVYTFLCHEGWEPFGESFHFAFKKYTEMPGDKQDVH